MRAAGLAMLVMHHSRLLVELTVRLSSMLQYSDYRVQRMCTGQAEYDVYIDHFGTTRQVASI